MNTKLKDIKKILASNNNNNNFSMFSPFSNALKMYSKNESSRLFKRVSDNLGDIKLFEPRLRKAYSPTQDIVLNYHTLWLSNHPDWKDYPKRDRAIIMAIGGSNEWYGDYEYRMFPSNGSKIAICLVDDLLDNFDKQFTIYTFNRIICKMFMSIGEDDLNIDYNKLMELIKKVDENLDYIGKNIDKIFHKPHRYFNDLIKDEKIHEEYIYKILKKGLYNYLTDYYNTDYVPLMTYEEMSKRKWSYSFNEVWVDTTCLGVATSYIGNLKWKQVIGELDGE